MQSDKNLFQADVQLVSLIKDMRQSVHEICQEHAEKKVRIEAMDGQVFEGVIVDYDEHNVYIEVDEEEEEDDYYYEEQLPTQHVASRTSFGDWGSPFQPYGGGFQPYGDFGGYGGPGGFGGYGGYGGYPSYPGYSPYSGFPPYSGMSPFADENPYGYTQTNPYAGGYPQGSSNRPAPPNTMLSPFGGKNAPQSSVSPFAGQNAPSSKVSPFSGKEAVSPFAGKNAPQAVSPSTESKPFQAVSPYQTFPAPFPGAFPPPPNCYYVCPPPPPPPPPPFPPPVGPALIAPQVRRKRRRRRGRKIIPLALFTLLSIVLI